MTDLSEALEGRYHIERELGQGGMATVYLAHDIRHHRKVALKVLRPELAAVIGAERFLAEIRTTANLQHPHILPLFDSGRTEGRTDFVFYVMPFVEGESLRDKLAREKQLGVDDAVKLVREVAAALDYAHRHGVIHRDIKPENILVHDGQALVADFGIALAVSRSDGSARMTETGLSLGTPHYMSPEQAMGEKSLDARTDIYALGCVLYELLTGEPPFTGPTAQAIVAKVLATEPEPVTTLRKTVPPHVVDAVHAAIQKLPADRWKSAAEFGAALDGRTDGRKDGTRTVGRKGASVVPSFRRSAVAGWGVALLAIIAAAAASLRPGPTAPISRFPIALPEPVKFDDRQDGLRLALSPDGRHVVHTSSGEQSGLWLWSLDQLESRRIQGTEGGENPAFSPDGRQLAFTAGNPRAILVTGISGGVPTRVTDSLVDAGGVSWGPDGIYFDGHLEGDGIAVVRGAGESPQVVTVPDTAKGESWHFQPEALPNGRGLLFTVSYGGFIERMQLGVFDFKTRTHRLLGHGMRPRWTPTGHVLFVTSDGTLMAVPFDAERLEPSGEPFPLFPGVAVRALGRSDVAVAQDGTLAYMAGAADIGPLEELVWVSRDGKAAPVDTTWRARFRRLSLSPDGNALATSLIDANGRQVWIKELDRGPAARLTLEGERNDLPNWSPDGRRIAFVHAPPSGNPVVFSGPADGSTTPSQMVRTSGRILGADFSPDGAWLILNVAGDVFARRLAGDTATIELLATPAGERRATVSPDGRWLAYESNESGQWEVYVRSFPDTRVSRRQVSNGGGTAALWSRDGREIFYESVDGRLIAVPVRPGPAFSIGEPRVLFSTAPFRGTQNLSYDVHPDGRRFIMARPLQSLEKRNQLVLVQNFFQELKGK